LTFLPLLVSHVQSTFHPIIDATASYLWVLWPGAPHGKPQNYKQSYQISVITLLVRKALIFRINLSFVSVSQTNKLVLIVTLRLFKSIFVFIQL